MKHHLSSWVRRFSIRANGVARSAAAELKVRQLGRTENRRASWAIAIAAACALQGCVLVPFITAFKQTGLTEDDRRALLGPEVKKYADALAWGSRPSALEVVADESKTVIAKQLRELGEEEHIVEAKIDEVEWNDDAFEAKVMVKFKYYRVPYYVVKTRLEEQAWAFYVGSGWRLKDRNVVDG